MCLPLQKPRASPSETYTERERNQKSQCNFGKNNVEGVTPPNFENYSGVTVIRAGWPRPDVRRLIKGKEERAEKQTHTNTAFRFLTKTQRQFNGERTVVLTDGAGTSDVRGKSMALNLDSALYTKVSSKWVTDLNGSWETHSGGKTEEKIFVT